MRLVDYVIMRAANYLNTTPFTKAENRYSHSKLLDLNAHFIFLLLTIQIREIKPLSLNPVVGKDENNLCPLQN